MFTRLAKRAGVVGRGFYSLRHNFLTVSDDAKDPVATAAVMGHIDASMSAHYREKISDERLQAVCEHVRRWLFGGPAT